MNARLPDLDRLLELSADDVLGELSNEEAAEYADLRARYPEFDPQLTERALGAALSALHGDGEALPESLSARLAVDLDTRFSPAPLVAALPPESSAGASPARKRRNVPAWTGWLAAAAALVLAIGVWISSPHPAREISSIEARRELLNSARPVLRVAWASASDPTGAKASGDIIWDSQQQVGYMRFVGLAPNDPSKEQYQLWIFDAERDERYPVDGGVFDIGRNGEVVVRIKAAVRVTKPVLFAVTVEKPGGVVVSDRSRIAVIAKPG